MIFRKRYANGNIIGSQNNKPLLHKRVSTIEFDEGKMYHYAENIITGYLYAQVKDEVWEHLTMSEIVEHLSNDSAVRNN